MNRAASARARAHTIVFRFFDRQSRKTVCHYLFRVYRGGDTEDLIVRLESVQIGSTIRRNAAIVGGIVGMVKGD